MSKTNQVCITCTQRDICQYYDTNRTMCVPVKVSDYGQFVGSLQPTVDWQHYRIKASIANQQAILSNYGFFSHSIRAECNEHEKKRTQVIAEMAVELADALIEELKKGGQQ